MHSRDCIVVMARQPSAGTTKTRLAATVGAQQAASVYEAFLLDTLDACSRVDAALLISYAADGPGAEAYVRSVAPGALLVAQPAAGFGERLASAMKAAFDRGFERVAVVGSDIPHMSSGWIADAFAALDDHDMALGPTQDGGYYLLALRSPEPRLFQNIDWSSGRELAQTRSRAAALHLRVKDTPTTFDIDDIGDLRALRSLVRAEGAASCPRTAAAMSAAGLLASDGIRATP